jgi:hypothetical protein
MLGRYAANPGFPCRPVLDTVSRDVIFERAEPVSPERSMRVTSLLAATMIRSYHCNSAI